MSTYVLSHRGSQGFTVAEMIVVIAVIGILISMTVFYFGDWRGRTAETEVKNSLQSAAGAMENARNFSTTGYPAAIPATFTASKNVNVELKSSTSTSYCINGTSTVKSEVKFYVTDQIAPTAGSCP